VKKLNVAVSVLAVFLLFSQQGHALIWGVRSGETSGELVQIDPLSGTLNQSFSLTNVSSIDTEIGLAGWQNELFLSKATTGQITVLNPTTGAVTKTFNISGGYDVDGLGYWSNGVSSYLYSSGCSVGDVHRYSATDGASPQYYYSNVSLPKSMAGDNGGRIFTYGIANDIWGIYEIDPLVNANATLFASSPSTSIVGMAFDGLYLYLSDLAGMLYTMNLAGQVIDTTELGYNLYALASTEGTQNAVPEPATMILLGVGLIAVVGCGKKKFNK
jgi:hypothetical protein